MHNNEDTGFVALLVIVTFNAIYDSSHSMFKVKTMFNHKYVRAKTMFFMFLARNNVAKMMLIYTMHNKHAVF